MKDRETWDDRYPILNHPYLHYGVVATAVNFSAGVDSGDAVILATTVPLTVTLPLAAENVGQAFYIKKATAAAGNLTIARAAAAETIDGAMADAIISTAQAAILIVSDGTGWWIIGDKVAVSPY
jgi:hypothetical protein